MRSRGTCSKLCPRREGLCNCLCLPRIGEHVFGDLRLPQVIQYLSVTVAIDDPASNARDGQSRSDRKVDSRWGVGISSANNQAALPTQLFAKPSDRSRTIASRQNPSRPGSGQWHHSGTSR